MSVSLSSSLETLLLANLLLLLLLLLVEYQVPMHVLKQKIPMFNNVHFPFVYANVLHALCTSNIDICKCKGRMTETD